MQTQKEEIRDRILKVAKREFHNNGYKRTSIQRIAELSDIAVGNVYNYFKSKDAILVSLCSPLLKALDKYLEMEIEEDFMTIEVFFDQHYEDVMVKRFFYLVDNFRQELQLLLFRSAGTPLEDFFDHYCARQVVTGMAYIKSMKKIYPDIHTEISPYFIESVAKLWVVVLKIMVQHEQMSREEQLKLIKDYTAYGTAGWKHLLQICSDGPR